MRKRFVNTHSYEHACDVCPWAAIVTAADGGYWCFESVTDYDVWVTQS